MKKSQPNPPPNAKIKKMRKIEKSVTDTQTYRRKTSNYSIDVPSMGNYAIPMTNMRGVENAFFVLKVEKKSTSTPPLTQKSRKCEKSKKSKKALHTDTRKTSNYSIDVPSMGNYAILMTNIRRGG